MELTRREMLAGAGVIGAWVLAGCQEPAPRVMETLPDPLSPLKADRLADVTPYAPPALPATRPATRPTTVATTGTATAPAPASVVIPRSAWARGGPILSQVEPMDGVQLLTFHHSGDPVPFYEESFGATAAHLESVREWHIHPVVSRRQPQGAGMCDIAYHFAIDRMGRVWELRNIRYQGEHVHGHNPHNLGVVVLGNFELQRPTEAQLARIRTFGSHLRRQYQLPLSRVFTHQELTSTECPGRAMQPYMVTIRRAGQI